MVQQTKTTRAETRRARATQTRSAASREAAARVARRLSRSSRAALADGALFSLATTRDWNEGTRWRRHRVTTLFRTLVALLVITLWAWMATRNAGLTTESLSHGARAWYAAAPGVLYVATLGILVDHFGARIGPLGAAGLHALGVLLALPVLWQVALANPAVVPSEHAIAALETVVALPLLLLTQVTIAYACAWFVPRSFPRQFGLARRLIDDFREPPGTAEIARRGVGRRSPL